MDITVGRVKIKDVYKILLIIYISTILNYFMFPNSQVIILQLNIVVIIYITYRFNFYVGLITCLPLEIITGALINTEGNWAARLIYYIGIAAVSRYWINGNDRDPIGEFTKFNGSGKLINKMSKHLKNNEKFCLVFIDITNFEKINMYIDYKIMKAAIEGCILNIKTEFKEAELYVDNYNKYMLIIKGHDEENITNIIKQTLENAPTSIKVDNYSYQLIVKAGIVFSDKKDTANKTIHKAKLTADQGEWCETGAYIYDPNFDNKRRLFHEISGSLTTAIKNDEFYLVYQPIINLKKNTISSVEVLTRWERGEKEPVGPSIFIKIAEETGAIQKMTRHMVKNLTRQLLEWGNDNFKVRVSINVTSTEMESGYFCEWFKEIVETNNIDKSMVGIEITERVLAKNNGRLNEALLKCQAEGYAVAIDDFGTGYNTFKDIRDVKANIIKIDKCYIDHISENYTKRLVAYIIDTMHEMGLTVIAEGVETKEQLMILKSLGCDEIQGYYFSKPLLPNDLKEYCQNFNMNNY